MRCCWHETKWKAQTRLCCWKFLFLSDMLEMKEEVLMKSGWLLLESVFSLFDKLQKMTNWLKVTGFNSKLYAVFKRCTWPLSFRVGTDSTKLQPQLYTFHATKLQQQHLAFTCYCLFKNYLCPFLIRWGLVC